MSYSGSRPGYETGAVLLLREAAKAGLSVAQTAYVLATGEHETMGWTSLYEVDWNKNNFSAYEGILGNTEKGDGAKYRGRGYVHLTGKTVYDRFGQMYGVDLVNNADLAAEPNLAARIAVTGMQSGQFTGVSLSQYINGKNTDFKNARRTVNRLNEATRIKGYADRYLQALLGCQ